MPNSAPLLNVFFLTFFFHDTFSTQIFTLSLHFSLFFFNDTATTEIYTLSLHDALPISRLAALSWEPRGEGLSLIDPVPYVEMLSLVTGSDLVITDSGGLQEETSFLGIPCLTVRPTTERPITCSQGTNRLVAARREAIEQAAAELWGRRRIPPPAIERWDGRAAERIVAVLCDGARMD